MSLPITEFLPDIIRTIASNPVSAIISPTGTGKSIAIPTTLAKLNSRVMVAVPTRNATWSLADYARTYSNQSFTIGTAAEGNVNYDQSTRLVYATAGHVRRHMLSYFSQGQVQSLDFVDILIVDEAHLATVDISIILDLWQYAYSLGVQVCRLVLTTATPAFLDLDPKPAEYVVTMRSYDITYKYYPENTPKLREDQIISTMQVEINNLLSQTPNGDILVFVPGSRQVDQLLDLLIKSHGEEVKFLAAYSTLPSSELRKIHEDYTQRKVVISTNIAETAITINKIAYVIDSMYEKLAETSQAGGFRLATALISKDSAAQRAGRTGRTGPGTCIRLITKTDYNKLPDSRPPEIERVPIYEILLELIAVGLAPERVLHRVAQTKILNTLHQLQKLQMIDVMRQVTPRGQFAPSYPLSVRNASVLYDWIEAGYPPFVGIVLVSLIDSYGPSYTFIPRQLSPSERDEYMVKYFEKYNSPSDLESALLIWLDLYSYIQGNLKNQHYAQWSKDNSMNNKKIKELLHVIKQCVNITQAKGYAVNMGLFPASRAIERGRPLLYNVYDDMELTHLDKNIYLRKNTTSRYILDKNSLLDAFNHYPSKILGLVTAEISTVRGNLNFVSMALDMPADPVEEVADILENIDRLI